MQHGAGSKNYVCLPKPCSLRRKTSSWRAPRTWLSGAGTPGGAGHGGGRGVDGCGLRRNSFCVPKLHLPGNPACLREALAVPWQTLARLAASAVDVAQLLGGPGQTAILPLIPYPGNKKAGTAACAALPVAVGQLIPGIWIAGFGLIILGCIGCVCRAEQLA